MVIDLDQDTLTLQEFRELPCKLFRVCIIHFHILDFQKMLYRIMKISEKKIRVMKCRKLSSQIIEKNFIIVFKY